jgi:hypothetical protein
MTFGEHLQAALQVFASRPLDDQEMRDLKSFQIGLTALVKQKLQQQQGVPGGMPGGPGQQPPPGRGPRPKQGMGRDEEPYGTGFGTPAAQGVTQPYGT